MWRFPHRHNRKILFFAFCPSNARLTPVVPEGGPYVLFSSPRLPPNETTENDDRFLIYNRSDVVCAMTLYNTAHRHRRTVEDIRAFRMQKAFDLMC